MKPGPAQLASIYAQLAAGDASSGFATALRISEPNAREQAVEKNGKGDIQQQRTERRLGRFYRRFILPDTVDAEKVTATGRDGVLAISIAKHPKAQPRRISVN
jgi:hypothetical protein